MEKTKGETIAPPTKPATAPSVNHAVLVGELCPKGAEGRPAVAPLAMKTVAWSAAPTETQNAIERGSVPRFAAFGTDGKIAGLFDTIGLADLGKASVASGTYVGGSPCSTDAGPGQDRARDTACEAAAKGCGLAVAELTRQDDSPMTPKYATGGACVTDKWLAIDIDGDGHAELFPLTGVLDGARGPAAEWPAAPPPDKVAECTPHFALYGIPLASEAKATGTLDVLGVVDLDGDGRREVVLALTFGATRTVAIFTAGETATRLTLAGAAPGFPR